MSNNKVTRRNFLQTAALAGTTSAAGGLLPRVAFAASRDESTSATIAVLDNANVVETVYGKVRGSERNGVKIFRGIPYAASTAGKNRFMPAQKAEPWAGIRSALWYEHVCPSAVRTDWLRDENSYMFQWNDGQPGEDCLRVNVWTRGINDNKKRPVMVWIHGGGYTSGSGQELAAYDGEQLCHRGDVVVVGFNHRLNTFGFLNLSEIGGPDYADSGNVGQTDLVFLLQWVRDNIANFGGDPANVTIMGQSGGGAKISVLLSMPSAQGLFHKASIHSGSPLAIAEKQASLATSAAVLAELGITKANLDKIHTISFQELLDGSLAGLRKANASLPPNSPGVPGRRLNFGPHIDGAAIPHHPFSPGALAVSPDIPIMVGTVLNEFVTACDKPDAFSLTKEQMTADLQKTYGEHTPAIIAAFSKEHPGANPFQLTSIIAATRATRIGAMAQANRKAGVGKAPSYNFWFHWQSPLLSGRAMAFHCADLSFFFGNAEDRCITMTGNTPEAQKLNTQMSEAWLAFAKTGNPNHPGIPKWNPVTPTGSESMIFDTNTHFSADSDSEARKVLAAAIA